MNYGIGINTIIPFLREGTLFKFIEPMSIFAVMSFKEMENIKSHMVFGKFTHIVEKGELFLLTKVKLITITYKFQDVIITHTGTEEEEEVHGPLEPKFTLVFLVKKILYTKTIRLRDIYTHMVLV